MSIIAQQLKKLKNVKGAIRKAILSKRVSVDAEAIFSTYAGKIDEIDASIQPTDTLGCKEYSEDYESWFTVSSNITTIRSCAFKYITTLTTLEIQNESQVITLEDIDAFEDTLIADSEEVGFIYVPAILVEDYKIATNWSTFASKIKSVEELPEASIQTDLIENFDCVKDLEWLEGLLIEDLMAPEDEEATDTETGEDTDTNNETEIIALYAWTGVPDAYSTLADTYYTTTETPSSSDILYDVEGTDVGISFSYSEEDNSIEILDGAVIPFYRNTDGDITITVEVNTILVVFNVTTFGQWSDGSTDDLVVACNADGTVAFPSDPNINTDVWVDGGIFIGWSYTEPNATFSTTTEAEIITTDEEFTENTTVYACFYSDVISTT